MKKILATFLIIFIFKSVFSLFIGGMVIYPDETCFFLKAKNFSETLETSSCDNLTELQIGNPYPLYSILISGVFLVFENASAQKAIFIINALLGTIIIFPLYPILLSHIKKPRNSLIYASTLTLIPIITTYERLIMSESLFLCIGVFTFYFYQKSLTPSNLISYINKTKTSSLISSLKKISPKSLLSSLKSLLHHKNKLIAIFLSILAIFVRPFGFILLLSILANEIYISKNRRLLTLISILLILMISLITIRLLPNSLDEILNKILSLKNSENYILILKSLKNQINSLSIETLLIPSLFFFSYLLKKSYKSLNKIKVFLITFILLNFLISAQHIYKYLLAGIELDLSSRYLNVSILFIFTVFFIIIEKSKELKISAIIFGIFTLPLFFLNFKFINHALNITLSPYYKNLNGFILENHFFTYIFLPLTLILLIFSLFNKKTILKIAIIFIIILQSTLISVWHFQHSKKELSSTEIQFFQNKKSAILIMKSYKNYLNSPVRPLYFDYFRLITLTNNNTTLIHFNDTTREHNENDKKWIELKKDFDYIISPFPLSLKIVGQSSSKDTIYQVK